MIAVKEAVEIAKKYSTELLGDQYVTTLEEVEMAEDGPWWNITLGYTSQRSPQSVPARLGLPVMPDFYKLFEVHRETGEVHAMKIRKVG